MAPRHLQVVLGGILPELGLGCNRRGSFEGRRRQSRRQDARAGVAHQIKRVQRIVTGRVANRTGRLLVGTSYRGGSVPRPNVVGVAGVLFLHGNHIDDPAEIRPMVQETRAVANYRGQPILFNEDDHFDFDRADNNFMAAIAEGASWGLFDYRLPGEGPECGFQSVPVDWRINAPRKRAFFNLVAEMAGSAARF